MINKNDSISDIIKKIVLLFLVVIISRLIIREVFSFGRNDFKFSKPVNEKIYTENLRDEIENVLANTSDSINKTCPKKIDSLTTLVNATFHGNVIQYNYQTIIDTSKYDMKILKNNLEKYILNSFINTSKFDVFRNLKATVLYNYSNPKNDSLFSIKFSPESYLKSENNKMK